MIDEDVYSETEKERNEISEKEMNISFVAFMNELKFKIIVENSLKRTNNE